MTTVLGTGIRRRTISAFKAAASRLAARPFGDNPGTGAVCWFWGFPIMMGAAVLVLVAVLPPLPFPVVLVGAGLDAVKDRMAGDDNSWAAGGGI